MVRRFNKVAGQGVPVRIRVVRERTALAAEQVGVLGVLYYSVGAERSTHRAGLGIIACDGTLGCHDDLEGHLVTGVVGQLAEHVVGNLPVVEPAVVHRADSYLRQTGLAGSGVKVRTPSSSMAGGTEKRSGTPVTSTSTTSKLTVWNSSFGPGSMSVAH